jgi:hypothetical protein
MIVQVTNTGDDLGFAHYDIQIPGGGFGEQQLNLNACCF